MTARSLIVGFDGFDLGVVRELGRASLPHLHQLMDRGAYAAQKSVQPPATLPNWTTFLTGVDPGRHGVFDFTTRKGYRVTFSAGTVREAPTIVSRLDRIGEACACIGFPATWPPDELENGIFVSGWDSPVAFEADRSFVWPPSLYDLLRARYGALHFDDVNEFDADAPGWHENLPTQLCARIARKAELGTWLLSERSWDLFAIYFGESDTASHYLWSLHDEASPRRPANTPRVRPSGLMRVYQALDEALHALLQGAGPESEVTIVSDHGFGGSSDKVLYLNRALRDAGLLSFQSSPIPKLAPALKRAALRWLGPSIRERVFRFAGTALPSWLESNARFGAIDMKNTIAFSDELNYFPAVYLNLAGREPKGIVDPRDIENVILQIERALYALVDPFRGTPVVRTVSRREELFDGPFVDRAPDLLLELHLDEGYSYNLMPSFEGPSNGSVWRRLSEAEKLGRKGRSLPGSHRPLGFMAIAGPQVLPVGELETHIADATATALFRHEVRVPPEMCGRVLWQALESSRALASLPPTIPKPKPRRQGATGMIESRLRALGYID